jgi:outer membrane protein
LYKPALILTASLVLAFLSSTANAVDLMEIYRHAKDSDPVYKQSIATYQATIEAKPQARAQLLPLIRFEANIGRHNQDITQPGFLGNILTRTETFASRGYTLDLTQPIFRYDRFLSVHLADSQIEQAMAQMDAAHQDLMVRTAQGYFNVLAANDDLAFARAEKTALDRQLDQSKQLFEAGMVAITDVQEAQSGYDRAVANEIAAINGVDNSLEALREITGEFSPNLSALNETIPLVTPDPENIEEWVTTSQQKNLQVIAARHALENAQETIDIQKAGHLPTVDLVAKKDFTDPIGTGTAGTSTTSLDDTFVGLQLNMPLFQGGLVNSKTRQAQQLYDRAQEQLEQQLRAAQRQTREAYLGVISGISKVTALKQAVLSSETALEATQAGYEVGTRTAVDVVTAQQTTFQAKRDYAQARYEYLLNTLRLKQAAGTLAPEDLAQINSWME